MPHEIPFQPIVEKLTRQVAQLSYELAVSQSLAELLEVANEQLKAQLDPDSGETSERAEVTD